MRRSRLSKIVEYLSVNGTTKITELAEYFYVSEMTIRRDVGELVNRNLVELVTGNVTLKEKILDNMNTEGEYFIDDAFRSMSSEKAAMAKKIESIIKDFDVVMLDNGTTIEQIAFHLTGDKRLTVITSNFRAAQKLVQNKNITLVLAGGLYHHDTSTLESMESIQLINRFRGSKVFISCSGVHSNLGITCNKMYEIDSKKALLDSCKEKYLVVDSSKFGLIHAYHFSDIEDFDFIITDKGISQEWIDYIKKTKVKLIIV